MRLALPMLLVVSGAARAECRDDRLTLTGGFGEAHFTVRIADDPGGRAQGLMHVESMATL